MDNALYQSLCNRIVDKLHADNVKREVLIECSRLFVMALNESIGTNTSNVIRGCGEASEFRQGEYQVGSHGEVEFVARVIFRTKGGAVACTADVSFAVNTNENDEVVIKSLDDGKTVAIKNTGSLTEKDFLRAVHLLEEPAQLAVERFLVTPRQ